MREKGGFAGLGIGIVGMDGEGTRAADESAVVYSYRPSLLGAPWEFKLAGGGIDWVAGSRSGHIPYRNVRRLRMSYKPASMQSYRFVTELWAAGAPKLQIVSSSWKNMVEQERLDRPYSAFIRELHRRVARAEPSVRFEQGTSRFTYWPGLIVFVIVTLGMAALVARGAQAGTWRGAAVVGAILALFLWQGGNFFRRNRPGRYRPDALPPDLMPRA